jgi:acylglycerol lipase
MKIKDGAFKGQLGLNLYFCCWLPDVSVKAVLVIAHGVAEHIGRYTRVAEYFVDRGMVVYGFDYRGHGRSEGRKGYLEDFTFYLDDLQRFLEMVGNFHPGKKMFLYGHSMGGEVALGHAERSCDGLSGLILSAPAVKIKPTLPSFLLRALYLAGRSMPGLAFKKLNSSGLSHDKSVVDKYDNDPLVYRGKLSAHLAFSIAWTGGRLLGQVSQIKIPVLVLHGEADQLVDPAGSQRLIRRIGSTDKTLKIYPGLYHEIHNEPEYRQVLDDIVRWIDQRSIPP